MKKLIFLASVLFMMSCGTEEVKKATEQVKDHAKEVKHEVKEHVEKVEEKIEEKVEEVVSSFSGDIDAGEALFTGKGCVACHAPDKKVVGPSLHDISEGYADNGNGMVSFLKEESDAIIDPAQFAVMQGNLAITKVMSSDELNSLVAFILKH